MGGWTGEGKDNIIWDGIIKAKQFFGKILSSLISWDVDVDLGSKNLTTTGDIQATTANLAGLDISNDGTKTTLLGTAGDYNRIGDAGTTVGYCTDEDDLYVSDKLEVKGEVYFNTHAAFLDDARIRFGNGYDGWFTWSTAQTEHTLLLVLGVASKSYILTDFNNRLKDHDHLSQANPTMFIHSATNPDTNNTQWLSLTHDQTDGVISTGKGNLNFISASGALMINGTTGFTGTGAYTNFTIVGGIITAAS